MSDRLSSSFSPWFVTKYRTKYTHANTANKLPQSVFSTAENGETKGQHPEMDQRDHHVCHVIKGRDEAILKSNAVNKKIINNYETSQNWGWRWKAVLDTGKKINPKSNFFYDFNHYHTQLSVWSLILWKTVLNPIRRPWSLTPAKALIPDPTLLQTFVPWFHHR